jgi:hypothetical protein
MRIAADDHVDVAEPGGHRQVGVVALMGDQDDVTDAPGAQGVDGFLGGIDLVEEAGARAAAARSSSSCRAPRCR